LALDIPVQVLKQTLWRMFAKLEEELNFLNWDRFYNEYMLFLKSEIPKLKAK
jgi:hypothetical protein